jgi:LPXTG-motif cell wall-anchored protein
VFAGQVVTLDAPSGVMSSSADPVRVTFVVSDVWKGSVPSTAVITTMRDSASCGYSFEQGQEYLVYATTNDAGEMEVSLCSRTQPLANANEDLAALGEAQPTGVVASPQATQPAASPAVLPATSSSNLSALLVVGGLGIVAMFAAGLLLRKRLT